MENEKWEMENTGMEKTVMGNTFFHSFFCFRLTVYNKEYIFSFHVLFQKRSGAN